jgi:hypothetical protein
MRLQKGSDNGPLEWSEETDDAYRTLKKASLRLQLYGFPIWQNLSYCMSERMGIAVGVLIQNLGTEPHL